MEQSRPETGAFIAKLIAADGFTEQKHFRSGEAALAWLAGEGRENFDGDVEKAELWLANKLLIQR
jgi:hypothetical protein